MLKLDRIIQLVRLNAEMAPIAVNDFGEQEGGSPDTTAKVWAQRTITSGGSFFRSDGRTSGQNIILATFIIRHRTDIIPMQSGLIDSDRRLFSVQSIQELRELGRSRWMRLECMHSSESYRDSTAPFSGRVAPPASFLLLEDGSRLLLESGDKLKLEDSA